MKVMKTDRDEDLFRTEGNPLQSDMAITAHANVSTPLICAETMYASRQPEGYSSQREKHSLGTTPTDLVSTCPSPNLRPTTTKWIYSSQSGW